MHVREALNTFLNVFVRSFVCPSVTVVASRKSHRLILVSNSVLSNRTKRYLCKIRFLSCVKVEISSRTFFVIFECA